MKYYIPITQYNTNIFGKNHIYENKKKFPLVFTNPRYNPETKRVEFSPLDYELKKSRYFDN